MQILILPDKFKFTFSSAEIGEIIENAIKSTTNHSTKKISVSDGGEGFLDALKNKNNFRIIETTTLNPIFQPIKSYFLIKNDTAYIEYAKTGGLDLLPIEKQNPMYTTSYGFGQQLLEAQSLNVSNIVVGLGGSATNDAGVGMADALGFKFFDKDNQKIKPIGANLIEIDKILKSEKINPNIKIYAATDVQNVLCGDWGASKIFARQKGANTHEIEILEYGMLNFQKKIYDIFNLDISSLAGGGAAGGLGAGISAFLNGQIISGSDFIFSQLDIEQQIKQADLIITGEGKLDKQSFNGKITGKIYDIAKKHNKKVLLIAGISTITEKHIAEDTFVLFDKGIDLQKAKQLTNQVITENIAKFL